MKSYRKNYLVIPCYENTIGSDSYIISRKFLNPFGNLDFYMVANDNSNITDVTAMYFFSSADNNIWFNNWYVPSLQLQLMPDASFVPGKIFSGNMAVIYDVSSNIIEVVKLPCLGRYCYASFRRSGALTGKDYRMLVSFY